MPVFLLFFLSSPLFSTTEPSPELVQLNQCVQDLSAMKSRYELSTIRRILANIEPRLGNMIQGSEVIQANARHLEELLAKPGVDPLLPHLIANAAVGCESYRQSLLRYVQRTVAFGATLLITVVALFGYYVYLTREVLADRHSH